MSTYWIVFSGFVLTMSVVSAFVFYVLERQTSGSLQLNLQTEGDSPFIQGKRDWNARYLR